MQLLPPNKTELQHDSPTDRKSVYKIPQKTIPHHCVHTHTHCVNWSVSFAWGGGWVGGLVSVCECVYWRAGPGGGDGGGGRGHAPYSSQYWSERGLIHWGVFNTPPPIHLSLLVCESSRHQQPNKPVLIITNRTGQVLPLPNHT